MAPWSYRAAEQSTLTRERRGPQSTDPLFVEKEGKEEENFTFRRYMELRWKKKSVVDTVTCLRKFIGKTDFAGDKLRQASG